MSNLVTVTQHSHSSQGSPKLKLSRGCVSSTEKSLVTRWGLVEHTHSRNITPKFIAISGCARFVHHLYSGPIHTFLEDLTAFEEENVVTTLNGETVSLPRVG